MWNCSESRTEAAPNPARQITSCGTGDTNTSTSLKENSTWRPAPPREPLAPATASISSPPPLTGSAIPSTKIASQFGWWSADEATSRTTRSHIRTSNRHNHSKHSRSLETESQLNSSSTQNWGHKPAGEAQQSDAATPAHWGELCPGDHVRLVCAKTSHSGIVDAASADGEYLWLVLSGGFGRRLFTRAEVARTYVDPMDLAKRSRPAQ